VREVAGSAAVDLLQVPAPVARLTGGEAAEDLGAFSYRYFADGTIEPDARWVRDNIRTEQVPVLGRVTCHRLMLPQLRGALQEVQDAGLAGTLKTYDGCYVPRFIERNPQRSISLHTWGIAIDMDAATNYRASRARWTAGSSRSSSGGASPGAATGSTPTRCTSSSRRSSPSPGPEPLRAQDGARSVASAQPVDAAARVRGRAAHPQPADRQRVRRPPGDRPEDEQLVG
jgi:hypothetical protein